MSDFEISHSHAFGPSLPLSVVRQYAPAVFAANASSRTRPHYRFISTEEVVNALLEAGFEVSAAAQTRSRKGSDPSFGKHMLRFRIPRESVDLVDALPEVIICNAHDATSAYQLIAGLYRPTCRNGMLCRIGDFGVIRVPHRKSVITDVVAGALQIVGQFDQISATVRAMADRVLTPYQQIEFARTAYGIRWARVDTRPVFPPEKLLEVRRPQDDHPTLWHVYNRCQEAAMAGGLQYQTRHQRQVTTRRIKNIREDVRVNTALWQAAVALLEI